MTRRRMPEPFEMTPPNFAAMRFHEPMERGELSGYVRYMTLVLLLDLQGDIDLAVDYLLPLWDLLSNYGVELDHVALAGQIDRDHGFDVGDRYREAVDRWRMITKRFAERNRQH